jgi:hypothetical protein
MLLLSTYKPEPWQDSRQPPAVLVAELSEVKAAGRPVEVLWYSRGRERSSNNRRRSAGRDLVRFRHTEILSSRRKCLKVLGS